MRRLVELRLHRLALFGFLISGCSSAVQGDPPAASGGTVFGNADLVAQAGTTGAAPSGELTQGGAGAAGAGGQAGAGPQGGAGTGGTPAPDRVHVVHGFLPNADWLTVTIGAQGMTDSEGLSVHVRVGQLDRPEWSRCWGNTHIVGGGFSITLPECDEVGIYKRRLAYIDSNRDGVCNEVVYGSNAAVREDASFTLAVSEPPPPAPQAMDVQFTEGDCAVFNEVWPEQ